MNPSTGSTCARAIDVHHHILPPAYIEGPPDPKNRIFWNKAAKNQFL